MKQDKIAFFGFILSIFLSFFSVAGPAKADNAVSDMTITAANAGSFAAMAEAKYERLMRTYVNKLKLAFYETDDAKTLEILNQFSGQFTSQIDALKGNLKNSAQYLSNEETIALNKRLSEKSHANELVALLYDARLTSRMDKNAQIKAAMETLQTKSAELQHAEFLATK